MLATRSLNALWCTLLATMVAGTMANAGNGEHLVNSKRCESSALLAAHCPSDYPNCMWLGDNELDTGLFRVDEVDATPPRFELLTIKGEDDQELKVGDIEALAALPDSRILVVGSLGHKSDCEWPKKRQRIAVLDVGSGYSRLLKWDVPWSCAEAFAKIDSPSAARYCALLQTAVEQAAAIFGNAELNKDQRTSACKTVQTFNLEGAAADPTQRVWLGARAPLLPRRNGAAQNADAVLLRLHADLSELGFDAMRRLDLDGYGIRELSASANWLWIIAGPAQDAAEPFALHRLAWAELQSGEELLHPHKVRELPTSAEGFALLGERAWIAIDGDDKDPSCATHEHLQRLDWPLVE